MAFRDGAGKHPLGGTGTTGGVKEGALHHSAASRAHAPSWDLIVPGHVPLTAPPFPGFLPLLARSLPFNPPPPGHRALLVSLLIKAQLVSKRELVKRWSRWLSSTALSGSRAG